MTERIAIVGFAARLPGCGADLDRFWELVAAGADASQEVPPGRWTLAPERCFQPNGPQPDAVYSSRGYYLDPFQPDLSDLAITPALVDRLDPLFQLILDVGNRAWKSAKTAEVDRRQVGVILGNICLPTDRVNELARHYQGRMTSEPVHPWNRYVAGMPAGLLAKALRLGGGTLTLDAACASSLYAIKLAADELLSGRADVMLAGGAARPDCQYTQMGFAQLRALSPTGKCAPFDEAADGLMVGEGAGIFVLKRLSDAERDGDTIHAVLAGWGLSNDTHGNLLAPAIEGQLRAMQAAYKMADWEPQEVQLIECHATGTPVGDAVEFESLRTLWGETGWTPGQCAIGSVKSTVGHLLTGAGAAALLKVILALAKQTKPPQANFQKPAAGLRYQDGPFVALHESTPWPGIPGESRKAAVSGFGFGGVNAHLLIEEYQPAPPKSELAKSFLAFTQALPRLTTVHDRARSSKPAALARPGNPSPHSQSPIAIVGLAAQLGPWTTTEALGEVLLGGGEGREPTSKRNGWASAIDVSPPGHFIEELVVPLDRFRIPPRELEEMLPQQVLILQVAADAIADAGGATGEADPRTGVFVGLGLDLNTTNYHLRWHTLEHQGPEGLNDPHLGPPLTADRTMGALGSIAASRISRSFHFGGPSFTICSEETSAGSALQLAVRSLQHGELDRAVVGGVDLAGDPRQLLATAAAGRPITVKPQPFQARESGVLPAEGAAAVVLKRLSDAERDGDRVYAVLKGIGSASGGEADQPGANASVYASSLIRACTDGLVNPGAIQLLEAAASGAACDDRAEADALGALLTSAQRDQPLLLSASRGQVGHTGAASILVGTIKAALALFHQTLPPSISPPVLCPELEVARSALQWTTQPQFWLADEPQSRYAAVAGLGADGSSIHVVLEAPPRQPQRSEAQPLGARHEAVFAWEGESEAELISRGKSLDDLRSEFPNRPIEFLAREWFRREGQHPERKLGLALVARNSAELGEQLQAVRGILEQSTIESWPGSAERNPAIRDRVFFSRAPLGRKAKLAFVYPGSGNQFAGMGQQLGTSWPSILNRQQGENQFLRSQYAPTSFWSESISPETQPHEFLFGQVAVGTLVTDLLESLGVQPQVMIGQSLGESAGYFGLRIWLARDEMLKRIQTSTLFQSDLAPPYRSARTAFSLRANDPCDWVCGVIPVPADEIRSRLRPGLRAYLLIVNTPKECVIGGLKPDVDWLVRALEKPFVALSGVTLAHCEAGKPVERAYRELHTLPTTPRQNLKVFSGAWARSYAITSPNAADSITAGLLNTIDFPAVLEAAYQDGVRFFVEVGPGSSCTRMISAVFEGRPHLVRSACAPRQDAESAILRVVAQCLAERWPVKLGSLYAGEPAAAGHRPPVPRPARAAVIPVGLPVPPEPEPPAPELETPDRASLPGSREESTPIEVLPEPRPIEPEVQPDPFWVALLEPAIQASVSSQTALAQAHETFLRVQHQLTESAFAVLNLQNAILSRYVDPQVFVRSTAPLSAETPKPVDPNAVPRSLTFEQCTEYAVGKIGNVLGPLYAEVDSFPTRVRLPEGPLMLVDRILKIEGEPKSMKAGRVVTEHTVRADRWYLDGGRCPTSVTVESGQADLFLSGFLGIDFQTRGKAVYRLLDAVVTFHRGLPAVGERIEYDIHIDEFFRQADAWLFRFRFEGTINGQPLLSMANGVAGFFTPEALAAGQGIIHTKLDKQPMPGKKPPDWPKLAPTEVCSVNAEQVKALHEGKLAEAFGSAFALLPIKQPMKLPAGMLQLVDRVPVIDPEGGRFSLGFVRAEYDIKPKEWFIECHFVDDKVMPGTLMYECCLHTLRTFLMHQGWVGEEGQAVCEPVPGMKSRLKCRGQVLDTTRLVTYEVSIKELGFGPQPYCIADALMFADGKPIVEITNLSLQMTGLSRERLEAIWSPVQAEDPVLLLPASPRPVLYGPESIRAFSNGNPSEAFGAPYRIFDQERKIARLPGPPYQFLDRIVQVSGEPFVLQAGASCTAEYDVPPQEWYFEANRCDRMPFSVLLEIALQPCGWLAAYCGSALTSEVDLSFRNLGGQGTQLAPVGPDIGTLSTQVKMTRVSNSAGMIIQHYDMTVTAGNQPVYQGTTYFGFFAKAALANQVGMPQAQVPYLNEDQLAFADAGSLPAEPPFPAPMLRMVDRIDGYLPRGGSKGLGLIQGRITVDPSFWFFQAHFYQDPVWPGSLGLESFLQLLKFVAWKRWKSVPASGWQTVAIDRPHSWTYRGQVIPQDREVVVVLEVTEVDDQKRSLKANGFLTVDGRVIYQMTDFSLE